MKYIVIELENIFGSSPDAPPYKTMDAITGPDNLSNEEIVESYILNEIFVGKRIKENGVYVADDNSQRITVTNIKVVDRDEWDEVFLMVYS